MGTVSSALSSTASSSNSSSSSSSGSGSSSTNSTGIFTGSSAYSSDFQNVINRAVAIATMPIDLLTTQQTSLTKQSDGLTTLDTKFASLQTALQSIQDALGGSGMQTDVSKPAVASVTVSDGAVEGAYSINVTSTGAYASSLSKQAWNSATDPSGDPTTYNLVVGDQTYSFTPATNSASAVASAISSQYGNLVQATAVNVGTTATPDYRISMKSTSLGAMDLKLQVPAQANLQWAQAATSGYAISQSAATWDSSGTPAAYTLSIDGTNYTLSPADNSANSVAAAINNLSNHPATATVVDIGTSDNSDYRIQLQSTIDGVSSIDLQDASGNLLQTQGAPPPAGLAVSQTAWSWDSAAAPSGNPAEYTFSIGDTPQTFTVTDNSADGVAAAINALGTSVQATVVDVGTSSAPDYRIQLVNQTANGPAVQLTRSTPFDLQDQGQPPGSLAEYEVSNSGNTVTSNSRNVNLATGTTLTLLGTGSTDLTVTRSTSTLSTALSSFADAYNAIVTELTNQRGQNGGALQGTPIVKQLGQALSNISTYFDTGAISGLANLGLSLGTNGQITYSPYTMMATDLVNSAGVTAFLGSTTGGGFLKAATAALAGVEDSKAGILKNAETDMQSRLSSLATTISTKQDKVSQMQLQLQDQMAQADALIASMEQQYSYMTSMFAAMETANQTYAKG